MNFSIGIAAVDDQLQERNTIEPFDHKIDPGETRNVAEKPAYEKIKKELLKQPDAGWKAATPTE